MTVTNLEKGIIDIITNHSGNYPITTKEIEEKLDVSNAWVYEQLELLRRKNVIESKKVGWIYGFQIFHKLTEKDWSFYISKTCGECHNWTPIKSCTFHEELADFGYSIDPMRIKKKISSNTVACPWIIERAKRWKNRNLQRFIKDIKQFEVNDENIEQPVYNCFFCNERLLSLGNEDIPIISSSVFRCSNCESMYKLVYNEKKEEFRMLFTEEKGNIYRKNFLEATGNFSEVIPYSSSQYGIVVTNIEDCILDFDSEIIEIKNWKGKLELLDYIVCKTREAYNQLTIELEDYKLKVIFGGKELISSPPREQQIGLLQLFREYRLLGKDFCLGTLITREAVLEFLLKKYPSKKISEAIQYIKGLQNKVSNLSVLTVKRWNEMEMNAGKKMWKAITEILEKYELPITGRCKGRYVREPFKPYRLYYAYTKVDVLINGIFSKMQDWIKEYCTKINFCWDGLPGICHKETTGGVFGFHLDQAEPFKLTTIPSLIEVIEKEVIDLEKIMDFIGRRRQKIYCIWSGTEIDEQLKNIVNETLERKANSTTVRRIIENYYFLTKNTFGNIERKSNNYTITHHGKEYALWAVKSHGIWDYLGREEKRKGRKFFANCLEENKFKPIAITELN